MRTKWLPLASLALAVSVAGAAAPARAADGEDPRKLEDTPKLSVRGEAELTRPADQVRLRIGVVTEAADAAEALKENTERMNAVIRAVAKTGLTEAEYETGRFQIRPKYSRRPRQVPEDWQPQIVGYEVNNSLRIETTKLSLAGDLIGAANAAGANSVEVAGFTLEDPRKYRTEAVATATRHALEDARTLADAASLELVRILHIALDSTPVITPTADFAMQARAMADVGAPPITPGDVTIRASVTIVYEIAPSE